MQDYFEAAGFTSMIDGRGMAWCVDRLYKDAMNIDAELDAPGCRSQNYADAHFTAATL